MAPVLGFIGMTHLGLNSAAATAERGFETVCFDPDSDLILALRRGEMPVREPDLDDFCARNSEHLSFTDKPTELARCDVVYVAPDVPTDDTGASDLSPVIRYIELANEVLRDDAVLVVLSQLPPGFIRPYADTRQHLFYQVETLIFGRAVERAMYPERFIVGCKDPAGPLPESYSRFLEAFDCDILPMRYESAELAKISINCCLVAAVTTANTLAELCERIGADWREIVPALRLDRRIGQFAYIDAGLGIAGGNLERDLHTVIRFAEEEGTDADVVRAWVKNSEYRKDWVLKILHDILLGEKGEDARVGVLGLAYKQDTHSTKNSASVRLLRSIRPFDVRVHDPVVTFDTDWHPSAVQCDVAEDVADQADAVVLMTPWAVYKDIAPANLSSRMRGKLVVDPFSVLDEGEARAAGLDYVRLGALPDAIRRRTGRVLP